MGKKGSQTARQASDLVLTDDNLDKIVLAIREGRKIYTNLIKAIRYIITIHIPIILTASLPVILGWKYPNIFTPIHIIFLELVMGPTCSIFFEKEPIEKSNIPEGPRSGKTGLFTSDELTISIVQGLIVTAGSMGLYFIFMKKGYSLPETRMMVFTFLILSNVFLTFSSRSFTRNIFHTIRYKNIFAPIILGVTIVLILLLQLVPFVQQLFQVAPVTAAHFWLCVAVSFVSVMWFELYKSDLTTSSR
ncbi:MAG: cation transporting ATPase C-terminal domain-containing protein, partial [Chitinophagaceae bacterium]